jgi:hypothetical protein
MAILCPTLGAQYSQASFTGATFKQDAGFNVAQIHDGAFFGPARFEGKADFSRIRIGGEAVFTGASFDGEFSLSGATITGDLLIWGTSFAKGVSLANASCRTIFVSPERDETLQISFGKDTQLNLSGCIYDHVHPISSWRKLMSLQQPYSRDPFNQLEQSLRRTGNDDEAAEVYYGRRLCEFYQKKKWSASWITEFFLRYLTGFGVRVRWLLWPIISILVAGTIIFSLDGALEPKQPTSPMAVAGASRISEPETLPRTSAARYINAFLISLDLFLPIADIPTVGTWEVSSEIIWGAPWLTLWAAFMTVSGWILVPIGIAGLTGLLKR